jgi:hypothetical protein
MLQFQLGINLCRSSSAAISRAEKIRVAKKIMVTGMYQFLLAARSDFFSILHINTVAT